MKDTDLNLPVNNELYAEEGIEVTESDENETIDDPRREAKTLGSDWTCSDNISICSDITWEEEIFGGTLAHYNPDRFIDTETILSHVEEQAGDMHKTDKYIDVDAIKPSNHDVDDPRKGTKAPENNVIYPSNTLQGNKSYNAWPRDAVHAAGVTDGG